MSPITLDVPEELAEQLRPLEASLPRILELGLRQLTAADQPGFTGAAEVFDFLAGLPTPQEILALQPTAVLQARVETLLEKNRTAGLSDVEAQEWKQYEYLEHLVRMAKAKALIMLNGK